MHTHDHGPMLQAIRERVDQCLSQCATNSGRNIIQLEGMTDVVFRFHKGDFVIAVALLGWVDASAHSTIKHSLSDSQNALVGHIISFRDAVISSFGQDSMFDEFCLRVCPTEWYGALNRHDAMVTKRLYFHALEGLEAAPVRGAGDITGTTRDAHKEHSQKTGCRGGGGWQQQKTAIEQETKGGRCDGGGASAHGSLLADDGHGRPIGTAGAGDVAAPSDGRGGLRTGRANTDAVALAVGTTPSIHIPSWATTGDETWVMHKESGCGPDCMRFDSRTHIVVGRSSEADAVLTAASCSRKHALLVHDGGVIRVKDLESKYGTSVRSTRVTRDQWTDIFEGDDVTFGATDTGEDASASVTYKLFRETVAGKSTTASGDVPFRSASGSGGLLRPAIGPRDARKETSIGDERTGTGAGHKPARTGTGNSDRRPDHTNVLRKDAAKKPRLSLDDREQIQAIELVAAAMRRDEEAARHRDAEAARRRDAEAAEEAAHRASQTAQASDHTFDTDRSDRTGGDRFEYEIWR